MYAWRVSRKHNRYDWGAVQAYYDAGNDRAECMARFGFTAVAWYKAIQRGKLRAELVRGKTIDWAAVQVYHDQGLRFASVANGSASRPFRGRKPRGAARFARDDSAGRLRRFSAKPRAEAPSRDA